MNEYLPFPGKAELLPLCIHSCISLTYEFILEGLLWVVGLFSQS